jgi:endonuclease IV
MPTELRVDIKIEPSIFYIVLYMYKKMTDPFEYAVGCHIAKISKVPTETKNKSIPLHKAIERDIFAHGLSMVQIYTHGPRNSRKNKFDAFKIKKFCQKHDIPLVVHTYHGFPHKFWKLGQDEKQDIWTLNHLKDQLQSCVEVGAEQLVVHLPDQPLKTMKRPLEIIANVILDFNIEITFENVPVKIDKKTKLPTNNISYPENVNAFVKMTETVLKNCSWSLTIDTAHTWANGLNLGSKKQQDDWFKELSKQSTKRIGLFHLNGSDNKTFLKGRDKHIVPWAKYNVDTTTETNPETKTKTNPETKTKTGATKKSSKKIDTDQDHQYSPYKPTDSGVQSIVNFAKKHEIGIICEINRGKIDQISKFFMILKSLF